MWSGSVLYIQAAGNLLVMGGEPKRGEMRVSFERGKLNKELNGEFFSIFTFILICNSAKWLMEYNKRLKWSECVTINVDS